MLPHASRALPSAAAATSGDPLCARVLPVVVFLPPADCRRRCLALWQCTLTCTCRRTSWVNRSLPLLLPAATPATTTAATTTAATTTAATTNSSITTTATTATNAAITIDPPTPGPSVSPVRPVFQPFVGTARTVCGAHIAFANPVRPTYSIHTADTADTAHTADAVRPAALREPFCSAATTAAITSVIAAMTVALAADLPRGPP